MTGSLIVLILSRSSRPVCTLLLAALVLVPATSHAQKRSSVPTTAAIAPLASGSLDTLDTPGVSNVFSMPSGVVIQVSVGSTGAPGGFAVEIMKRSDFDALGGWPDDQAAQDFTYASFAGVPTLHVTTSDFTLDPGTSAKIYMGELFDETGIGVNYPKELDASTQYVVRVTAQPYGTIASSAPSANLLATTLALNNCTFTQGYWKNHPDVWPVTSLTLGSHSYTETQLLNILKTPASGNGLISLAHQLIAAKLNVAQGANISGIGTTIASADALIGSLLVPPVGSGYLAPSTTDGLTNTLDQFNNGLLGVDHCSGTVVHSNITSLGGLRIRYR